MEKPKILGDIFNVNLDGWRLVRGHFIGLEGGMPYLAIGGKIIFTDDLDITNKIADLVAKKDKRFRDTVNVLSDMMLLSPESETCFFLESGRTARAWHYFPKSELEEFLKNPVNYKWQLPTMK